MSVLGWIFLAAVIAAAARLSYIIHREVQGPSHCMGCGKCSGSGVCILTGEPVGPRRKRETRS